MHKLKLKPTLFIIFIFIDSLSLTKSYYSKANQIDSCLTQVCNINEPISRYVHFPFLTIKDGSFPRYCGYPGFDLFCDSNNQLSIDLPNSGVFSIKGIDYVKQEFWLNDPSHCLPKRLLERNLLGSNDTPFVAIQEHVYWLYNCSNSNNNNNDTTNMRLMKRIDCLSGTNYSVVAFSNETYVKYVNVIKTRMYRSCGELGSIRVPIGWSHNWDVSSDDVRLTWTQPKCGQCVQGGGQCGFNDNTTTAIGCFNLPRRGLPRSAVVALFLAFAVPLALLTACITYYIGRAICHRRRRRNNNNATNNNNTVLATTASPTTSPDDDDISPPMTGLSLNFGLDRSIIETYPKTVLGESKRLPKPEDKTCPICLGEYLAKETLRSLPQCGHSFHVDCIDEWLHLNASCPVCRNSPPNYLPHCPSDDDDR